MSVDANPVSALNGSPRASAPFRWTPDAVRRLCEDVEWALTSNPTGPAEVAGLLLSKRDQAIEIVDCEPVFLMQKRDHAFALEGPGRHEFQRKMAALRSLPHAELSPIGFYRSHMGEGLDLTDEDLALLRSGFRGATPVVLLVQFAGNGSSRAKLFVGERGEAVWEFHSSTDAAGLPRWLGLWDQLSANDPPQAAAPSEGLQPASRIEPAQTEESAVTAEQAPIASISEVQEDSLGLKRRLHPGWASLWAAMLALAVLIGYLVFNGSAVRKPALRNSGPAARPANAGISQASGLALRLERQGEDLRLDWDRTASVLVSATGGMLTIRDGEGLEKQILLDMNLLTGGSVVYRPVHDHVSFGLVILGKNGAPLGKWVATYP